MNYKAMSDMVLFRHIWRMIVKMRVNHKSNLPYALKSELYSRNWENHCYYCEIHLEGHDCSPCPLKKAFGDTVNAQHFCVPPFYDWWNGENMKGAKQILEVIEKDMGG